MDEWAVRGTVMKTGLGGEKVRVKGVCESVCVWGCVCWGVT